MTATTLTLLTPEDLAAQLGHSADWWVRRARAKKIPHRRVGQSIRFAQDDVAEIVAGMRVDPVDPLRSQTGRSRGRRS